MPHLVLAQQVYAPTDWTLILVLLLNSSTSTLSFFHVMLRAAVVLMLQSIRKLLPVWQVELPAIICPSIGVGMNLLSDMIRGKSEALPTMNRFNEKDD